MESLPAGRWSNEIKERMKK
ncbi:hypothetical protein CCACVL1_03067 [Corchorus capsularis]|uniref:Uncharacterized protein n=1 Tax=Corchorus capsularis TaxID=210143 RepID=A0A1R3K384_COCAP|nr:hypothetical protein CCACVL1_03069 [Corchorus capsularis]OMP01535.1 hypothetical protein CCACVL1_03067 [Corchorus capsularis]